MHCFPAQGKVQGKCCARAGTALYANFSRMFLNNPVGDGQAKSRAAALPFPRRSLSGEERIVNTLDVLRRNARSRIGDAHADTVSIQSYYAQLAAARHRIFSVEKQIQEHLLQSA